MSFPQLFTGYKCALITALFTPCVIFITLVPLTLTTLSHTKLGWARASLRETYGNLRKNSRVNWKSKIERSRSLPKFDVDLTDLSLHVISLNRSSGRRQGCVEALRSQNISYTVFPAVDGLNRFFSGEISRYAGLKKRETLRRMSHMTVAQLSELHDKYVSNQLSSSERADLHERLRFGCTLSHVRVWLKLLSSSARFFVVLEDDAIIAKNFSRRIRSALRELPVDWELFYLNVCSQPPGPQLTETVRQLRGGSCISGYAVSRTGAERLVYRSAEGSDLPVDNMMKVDVAAGLAVAFYADPPLVSQLDGGQPSTLAYP